MALQLALMAVDGFLASALFVFVSIVRFGTDHWEFTWLRVGTDWRIAAGVYGLAWVGALWLHGLYQFRARWSIRGEITDIARSAVLIAVVTFSALFVFKLPEVSRLFLLILFASQIAVAFVSRWLLRLLFAFVRSRGLNAQFVLVVGTNSSAVAMADRIERHRDLGLRVVGHLTWPGETASKSLERPVLGTVNDIETVFGEHIVDEVLICPPAAMTNLVEPIASLCQEVGKIVRIPLDRHWVMLPGGRIEDFDGTPVLSLIYGPDRILGLIAKRVLDITVGLVGLVVLTPLFAIVAIWVMLLDGAPVLFRQVRVGLHGRPFRVLKFRTMVPDAEEQLEELLDQNEIKGHAFKLTSDPRLSRTGNFLRRTSIDELPQLWNVVRGDMSLVGPRPPLPREVAEYDLWHRRRLSMKPGITGLWQIEARRDDDFDRWVELDLAYIDRWSIWLDLKIMLRTIPAMLQGR